MKQMSEAKALKDCKWRIGVTRFQDTFNWIIWTTDETGEGATRRSSGLRFQERNKARADCEAFMARNGWTNWEWSKYENRRTVK